MMSKSGRALTIAIYFFFAWKFLTFASLAGATAAILTVRLEPGGVLFIPIAGVLAALGWYAMRSLKETLATPYY